MFARLVCGENAVRKWRNGGAMTAVFGQVQAFIRFICGGSTSDSYESEVKLRLFGSIYKRFLCVIQMIARFICGKNMVRKWQNAV